MDSLRTYGDPPYETAVIHGGPGAGGEMAPVARQLALERGILEPIQTEMSLEGQVNELKEILESSGDPPVTLIGFSWGAWLSFITAARHPDLVRKLILVGSGPFREEYVPQLHETRMRRLSREERAEWEAITEALADPEGEKKDALITRLGVLASKTDTYDPVPSDADAPNRVGARGDLFQAVWARAAAMRRSGELLALGGRIRCPVVAIHGDYDPHPAEGVEKPLTAVLDRFHFVLLETCGHKPWIERGARDQFFAVVEGELR